MFHHTNKFYEPGEVIERGNWGRVVRGYGTFHGFWAREDTWERVRAQEFPDLPSRLACAYAYEDLAAAMHGRRDGNPDVLPWIYEVEPTDPEGAQHRADLWFMNHGVWEAQAKVPNGGVNLGAFVDLAKRYWRGERPGFSYEVLLASDLLVTRVVRPSEAFTKLPADQFPPGVDYERDGTSEPSGA